MRLLAGTGTGVGLGDATLWNRTHFPTQQQMIWSFWYQYARSWCVGVVGVILCSRVFITYASAKVC
jgi:hypothetical protein